MDQKVVRITITIAVLLSISFGVNGWGISLSKPRFGECPTAKAMKDFSTENFQGVWYVGYQFQQMYNPCTVLTFNATSALTMNLSISNRVSPSLSLETKGKSFAEFATLPAAMKWRWNYLPVRGESATIVDTDYSNYAVLFNCQSFVLMSQPAVVILTRKDETVSDIYLQRAKKIVENFFPVEIERSPICIFNHDPSFNETTVKSLAIDKTISQILNFFNSFL